MTARVLVVDDVEANRKLLQAKLNHEYFEVVLARDGHEALALVKEHEIDIVLLDVMMPGIDGYEVCRRMKADPHTSHTPVVMVTALGDREHRVRGLQAGAEDFVTKPINDFALLSRMRALMRYNRVVAELRQREAGGKHAALFDLVRHDDLERPARVFIVDDSPRRAAALRDALVPHHIAVTMQEAPELAVRDQARMEVILVSMAASTFDPLRLCATFLNGESTRGCSIIAVADPGDERAAVRALDLGASDVIAAPVDPEELMARVRTQARRVRYLDILRRRVDLGLEMAVIDQLTGLKNRRYMTGQLTQWVKRAEHGGDPVSLIIMDLDHFKRVNDCFGHQAGDEVLKELAERLEFNTRPSDIACRYGGEEFVVIMPETSGDMACTVAERIRSAIAAQPFQLPHGERIQVTCSIGVATCDGGETPAELIERADRALYAAKSAGRNQVISRAA